MQGPNLGRLAQVEIPVGELWERGPKKTYYGKIWKCLAVILKQKNHLEYFLRHRSLGSTPRVSDSAGLVWGLRICVSNKMRSMV
jgi:hypothetical protein